MSEIFGKLQSLVGAGKVSYITLTYPSGTTNITLTGLGKTWKPTYQSDTVTIWAVTKVGSYTASGSKSGSTKSVVIQVGEMEQVYSGKLLFVAGFAVDSWDTISSVAREGTASTYYNVNDRRMINVDGKAYEFAIMGFDTHDAADASAYGRSKVGITIGMVNCLDTTHNMNSSNTNSGGWGNPCGMKTWLNGLALDSDLASVITYGKLPYCATYDSSTMSYDTTSKLFLPSYAEIFGNESYSYEPKAKEGSQFAYYANGGSKIKNVGSSASLWWLRSVNSYNSFSFCYVYSDGTAVMNYASSTFGVAPCFCV